MFVKLFRVLHYSPDDSGGQGGGGGSSAGDAGAGSTAAAGSTGSSSGQGDQNSKDGGADGGAGDQSKSAGKQDQPFAVFQNAGEFMSRVERESKKKLDELAKQFGYESKKDMEAALKAKKEADEKSKTDLEKLQDQLNQEKAARASSDKKIAGQAVSQALMMEAVKLNFIDPGDAVALAAKDGIGYDQETGQVEGAAEAIKKLAESKPHLIKGKGSGVGSSSSPGGDPSGLSEWQIGQKLAKEHTAAASGVDAEAAKHYYDPWAKPGQGEQ